MHGLSGKFFVGHGVSGANSARICYEILSASQPYVVEDFCSRRFTHVVLVLRPDSALVTVAGADPKVVIYDDAEEAMAIETVEVGLMALNRSVYDDVYAARRALDRNCQPPKRFAWDAGYQA